MMPSGGARLRSCHDTPHAAPRARAGAPYSFDWGPTPTLEVVSLVGTLVRRCNGKGRPPDGRALYLPTVHPWTSALIPRPLLTVGTGDPVDLCEGERRRVHVVKHGGNHVVFTHVQVLDLVFCEGDVVLAALVHSHRAAVSVVPVGNARHGGHLAFAAIL